MSFAFRRFAEPFVINVSPTSAPNGVVVAGDPRYQPMEQGSSFLLINPNPFCVRIKGSSQERDGGYVQVAEDTGLLLLPWEKSVWTRNNNDWVSAMSVTRGGIVAGTGNIELAYGTGM